MEAQLLALFTDKAILQCI